MMNWDHVFAARSSRMRASEIRELLKLLDCRDITSFAGGIPDPALFPEEASWLMPPFFLTEGLAKLCNIR